MSKIYFVRHGRAAAGFGEDMDPGLDDLGRQQAEEAAQTLAKLSPIALRSSPLKRARETAMPLEARWNAKAAIDDAVAEIPSPTTNLAARVEWLRGLMAGAWTAGDATLQAWRGRVIESLLGIETDTVIFSHFIAINVAAGHALGDDRVVVFTPDNASISVFENDGRSLKLVELGRQAQSKVN